MVKKRTKEMATLPQTVGMLVVEMLVQLPREQLHPAVLLNQLWQLQAQSKATQWLPW